MGAGVRLSDDGSGAQAYTLGMTGPVPAGRSGPRTRLGTCAHRLLEAIT